MATVLTLLLVLLCCSSPAAATTIHEAAGNQEHEYTLVAMSSLEPMATTCSGHRVAPPQNTTWVPLNLPHGPCSPLSGGATTPPPSLAELLRLDQLRADDILARLLSGSGHPINDSKPTRSADGPEITMHGSLIGVGLGPRGGNSRPMQVSAAESMASSSLPAGVLRQTVVVDTASDVPWVQCVSCPVPPCHPQPDTVYDPTRSSTYAAFSCNSPACAALGPYANGCVNNQCQYKVTYPDGSSSSGTYSSDVLTFDAAHAVTNFQFGCSHVEQGSFDNSADGIMALGGGSESLLAQVAPRWGNAFSYCIPPAASYSGFFGLGAPGEAASRFAVTPLLRYPQAPTFYRVLLRDITVGGRRLGVPAAALAPGAIMDSRTAITRLPPTAYSALRAAFRNAMGMYRSAPPKGILDTCYDFTGVGNVRLPRISLVFDRNAVVELDPSGILLGGCLAFASNGDDRIPGIIGSVQQQTFEVLYAVGGGAVGFRRGAC
ncbi:unnamed protein product [Urochloa humidicola]